MIYELAHHIVKTELLELQLHAISVIRLFSSMKAAKTSFKRLFFFVLANNYVRQSIWQLEMKPIDICLKKCVL